MKVLIACEYSGVVRDAFIAKGHDAISCDLLPSDKKGPHFQGNVLDILYSQKWDLMIAHPPCTHLAVSGARHFPKKIADGSQQEALDFVLKLMQAPIEKICIENPISIISSKIRKPDQIIQPYMFGHKEQKSTCLWLKNLPKLIETKNVKEEMLLLSKKEREKIHFLPPSKDRWKIRSTTYQGIAEAMAVQWG